MSTPTKLVFVYNANSGMLNAMFDSMHKIVSPTTYSCTLCKITYGTFTEMPEWKEFKKTFPGEMVFYHIDEFERLYPPQESYPVVLTEDEENITTVLSTERIDGMRDLEELIQFFRDWANIDLLLSA